MKKKPHVLLAEDDLDLREQIAQILVTHGIDVKEVGSGDAALGELGTHTFDLLITDVMMPSPVGVQVAAMARTAGEHVPILVITASKDPEIAQIVSRLHHARLLYKPFSMAQLLGEIGELVPDCKPSADTQSASAG